MLDGLARHPIIVGAYSTREGICPMLAAHRCGGRTNFIGFAEAWDRFAQRSMRTKRARRATEREILFLRAHLEASLMEDGDGPLAGAIADHRRLLETAARVRRDAAGRSVTGAGGAVPAQGGAGTKGDDRPGRRDGRPGDPDRSGELRRSPGWAWTRLFRRLDDYERALRRLEVEADRLGVAEPLEDAEWTEVAAPRGG